MYFMINRKTLDIAMAVLFITGVICAVVFGLIPSALDGEASDDSVEPAVMNENGRPPDQINIVIDPGHGGADPGKIGASGSCEREVNLAISMLTGEMLTERGYNVFFTRRDDNGLYDDSDVNKKAADMRKRCSIIEEAQADVVISIHQNSFTDSDVCGAQMFYYTHSAEGKKLAEIMQESFRKFVNTDNTRGCKANDSYYMLIHTPCPTVIAECGFLSNPEEEKQLNDNVYRNKIALAITEAVEKYFGNDSSN